MSDAPIASSHIYNEANAGRMGARLMAIVAEDERGRVYLAPTPEMEAIALTAQPECKPEVAMPENPRWFSPPLYGLKKYVEPVLVKPRLGQGSFRVSVTEAYKQRCAMTGENTLVALEAAHITPYSSDGDHDIRNGLLLHADFHRLFDAGLISVTPEMKIRVTPQTGNLYDPT
jgi:hypothetical protein